MSFLTPQLQPPFRTLTIDEAVCANRPVEGVFWRGVPGVLGRDVEPEVGVFKCSAPRLGCDGISQGGTAGLEDPGLMDSNVEVVGWVVC